MNRIILATAALLASITLSAKSPDIHRIMTCNVRGALAHGGGYYGIGKNLIMYYRQRYELPGQGT
jgi:hypothetical protein